MSEIEVPLVDYGQLTDEELVEMAFNEVGECFNRNRDLGLLRGPKGALLHIRFGTVDHEDCYQELGCRNLGGEAAEQFEPNTSPDNGKLSTAIKYFMDSGDAARECGDAIPEGPQRWTGGAYYLAVVETVRHGRMALNLAGAASGLQGRWDLAFVKLLIHVYATLWCLKQEARYGKPERQPAPTQTA